VIAKTPILEIKGLTKHFPIRKGLFQRVEGHVRAVDGIDLEILKGETLGLVGESGCGKTTTGRCILRLLEPTKGEVFFKPYAEETKGQKSFRDLDITAASSQQLKSLRKEMQIIFQDPFSSLSPRMTVGALVGEPLIVHGLAADKGEHDKKVAQLLTSVGLKAEHMRRYPHEFSGGQRQRIAVARALASEPSFIVADEPVSALDVSVQAQVLNLLRNLQKQRDLTYLFITHDLSVVKHISDRIAVMYLGRIVELASSRELFRSPGHPYTEALMSALPVADPDYKANRILLEGDVPNPSSPPSGCHFHPRCRYAVDKCRMESPAPRQIGAGHMVSCHLTNALTLAGIQQA